MIKLIVAIHKRADLSSQQFHDHWRNQHAELVRTNPATQRYVKKYVQCHTLKDATNPQLPVAFDGTAELWFESIADQQAFFSDPDYLANIQPDEARFADMERTVFFITEEVTVVGGE